MKLFAILLLGTASIVALGACSAEHGSAIMGFVDSPTAVDPPDPEGFDAFLKLEPGRGPDPSVVDSHSFDDALLQTAAHIGTFVDGEQSVDIIGFEQDGGLAFDNLLCLGVRMGGGDRAQGAFQCDKPVPDGLQVWFLDDYLLISGLPDGGWLEMTAPDGSRSSSTNLSGISVVAVDFRVSPLQLRVFDASGDETKTLEVDFDA